MSKKKIEMLAKISEKLADKFGVNEFIDEISLDDVAYGF